MQKNDMNKKREELKMKKIQIIAFILIFTFLISPISIAKAQINTATAKTHKEKRIFLHENSEVVGSLYLTNKEKLKMYVSYNGDDTPEVYRWTGKKLVKDEKDPLKNVSAVATDDWFSPRVTPTMHTKKNIWYCAWDTTVYKYDKKEKIKAKVNLKKPLKLKKLEEISEIYLVKNDLLAVETPQRICLVSMKTKKVVKKFNKKYTQLLGATKKYLYVKSGTLEEKNETIYKVNIKTKKECGKIEMQSLRDQAANRQEKDEDGSLGYARDYSFTFCVYKGKVYVKYLTGVYRWNEKKASLDMIIEGSKNFQAGLLDSAQMVFTDKNTLFITGYFTNTETPTGFFRYKIS